MPRAERSDAGEPTRDDARAASRGIALGYLAMLPLLCAYEAASQGGMRNVAEVVFTLPLAPFSGGSGGIGGGGRAARLVLLGVLAIGAIWSLYRSGIGRGSAGLVPRLWRILLEGALCALLLGPALLFLLHLLGLLGASPGASDLDLGRPGSSPRIATVAFLAGGAAWEEIVFRIGIQSLAFLAGSRVLGFLVEDRRLARAGAEGFAVVASAAVFAGSHLAVFTQRFGPGGEEFVPAVFTWRLSAGILLGVLFRWRGPGVAAWAHALFNACLAIGAGPDVFL